MARCENGCEEDRVWRCRYCGLEYCTNCMSESDVCYSCAAATDDYYIGDKNDEVHQEEEGCEGGGDNSTEGRQGEETLDDELQDGSKET